MLSLKFLWKNKISVNYCVPEEEISEEDTNFHWRNANHTLLQQYFKLYSDFKQLQNFFVVAHRNYVSIYNFAKKIWVKH